MEFTFVSIAATKPSTPNPFDVTLLILSGIEIHLSSHFIVPNTHFIVLRTLAMETTDGGAVGIVKDDNSDSKVRLEGRCLRGEFIFNVV